MVKFEPAPLEPVEESTLLPARAVTEGSPCLRDGRLEVPRLMVTLRAEGPGPEPSVALTCESTQLLRCLQKVEDGGRCDRPSLVFLQSTGETEREGFDFRFAGVVELVSVGAIDGAGDIKTPALRRQGSVRSVRKKPGFLVFGLE